jgi:uncharacterized membrane protein YdjX (TVP38/TMEM64 family)
VRATAAGGTASGECAFLCVRGVGEKRVRAGYGPGGFRNSQCVILQMGNFWPQLLLCFASCFIF